MNDTIVDSIRTVADTLHKVSALAANEATAAGNDAINYLEWLEQHNVLVSVIIFVLGWILTVIIAKIGEWIKRCNFKHVVLDWIELTVPMEKHLAQSLGDLSVELKTTDEMIPLRYNMPLTVPNKIRDMSVERMMDSFMAGWYCKTKRTKRSSNMYNIISQFEYLTRASDEIIKAYESYNTQTYAQVQEWNVLNNQLRQMLLQHRSEAINSIVNKFDSDYETSPNSLRIRNLFVESFHGSMGLGNAEIALLQRMHQVQNQIEVFQRKYAEVFEGQAKAIEDSVEALEKARKFFRKNNKFEPSVA